MDTESIRSSSFIVQITIMGITNQMYVGNIYKHLIAKMEPTKMEPK